MNIIKNKKIVNSFGRFIDLTNTLNGGVSMAQMQVLEKKNRWELLVKAPGINPEALRVVIDHNKLFVSGLLPQNQYSENKSVLNMPLFSTVFPVPFEADVTNLQAIYADGILKIMLPKDERRSRGQKNIPIEER